MIIIRPNTIHYWIRHWFAKGTTMLWQIVNSENGLWIHGFVTPCYLPLLLNYSRVNVVFVFQRAYKMYFCSLASHAHCSRPKMLNYHEQMFALSSKLICNTMLKNKNMICCINFMSSRNITWLCKPFSGFNTNIEAAIIALGLWLMECHYQNEWLFRDGFIKNC